MSKGTSLVQIIHLTVTFLYSFRTVSCDYLLALNLALNVVLSNGCLFRHV